jgi:NAD(P)H dehydrogenase (quinone)
MIAITGANGQLGRLVIQALLQKVAPEQIVAVVRSPEKAQDLIKLGVSVRHGDYALPASLTTAFDGIDKVLLISSSELGQRGAQHQAVISAAKAAGVKLLAYTSLLHADTSPLNLAAEHLTTEAALKDSGVPHVLLRNGWYTENRTGGIASALQYKVLLGSAKDGLTASAARADYAEAAAVVLTTEGHAGRIYELAGDTAYTLAQLAAEITRQSGEAVAYQDLPEADFKAALMQVGLPEQIAELIANSDAGCARGGLFDDGLVLGQLIGRATTPWAESVGLALKA